MSSDLFMQKEVNLNRSSWRAYCRTTSCPKILLRRIFRRWRVTPRFLNKLPTCNRRRLKKLRRRNRAMSHHPTTTTPLQMRLDFIPTGRSKFHLHHISYNSSHSSRLRWSSCHPVLHQPSGHNRRSSTSLSERTSCLPASLFGYAEFFLDLLLSFWQVKATFFIWMISKFLCRL